MKSAYSANGSTFAFACAAGDGEERRKPKAPTLAPADKAESSAC